MGYDLHITRREDWAYFDVSGISIEEWLSYINGDKELELMTVHGIKIETDAPPENEPGFCEWNGHPTEKEPGARPWFSYSDGNIETKHPDPSTIRKMIQIASALNARVQGDDGEVYTIEYLADLERSEKQKASSRQTQNKPWWKLW